MTSVPRPEPPPGFDRLRRALEVHETFLAAGGADPRALLTEHEDLRDLLEPLLLPEEEDAAPEHESEEVVGGFRILLRLGCGGMGVVYEAEQLALGRRVALKVLPLERLEPRALARFRREALAGGRLNHPAIVSVISCGESNGLHWIAQELVPGGRTLEDFLKEARALRELGAGYYRAVARILAETAEGLAAAHAVGIVHRDVKPGNVLLTPEGRPKVADFGLARLADSLTISRSSAWIGTPFYMSPEQCDPRLGEVGEASDQFALGVTLYEALTLRRPFEGDTSQHVLREVCEHDPPDPTRLHSQIPRDLSAVCLRALEKRPAARYASVAALAADLRRFLAGEPVEARIPGTWTRARRWVRRHPVRMAAGSIAAVALIAIGALAVAMLHQSSRASRNERLASGQNAEKRVRALHSGANELWPLHPSILDAGDAWVCEAEELLAEQPAHESHLAEMRSGAHPGEADDELAFDDPTNKLAHDALAALITALDELAGEGGRLEEVRERLRLVRSLEKQSMHDPEAVAAWAVAREAVASHDAYGGLGLQPQLGLLPLGPDPASGLWEFAHLATGKPPFRDPVSGSLAFDAGSALVLVLVPGGTFVMGSQSHDSEGPSYDALKDNAGEAVHERALEPFLLSKFEMTQAQWQRATGANPSHFASDDDAPLRPVEQITWIAADLALGRIGLRLPFEAEWEYACRAGTNTTFSFGNDPAQIALHANIRDETYTNGVGPDPFEPVNDGHIYTAPVGSYLPNAFGFHDMHGNVCEWCADLFGAYPTDASSTYYESYSRNRVHRGGGFHRLARNARCAARGREAPDFLYIALGVRPARSLDLRR